MSAPHFDLPGYQVASIDVGPDGYCVNLERSTPPVTCHHCNLDQIVGFGRREQVVRDLPAYGHRVSLHINTRRYHCKNCEKTYYEPLPEVDQKRLMTSRLVSWMGEQAISRTFAGIADEVGCTEYTVRSVFHDYIQCLESQFQFQTPKRMAISALNLNKHRGLITNVDKGTIVDLLQDCDSETFTAYLLGLKDRQTIQCVVMGMWASTLSVVEKLLPKAMVVIDPVYVLDMADQSVEQIRKRLRESLSPTARRDLCHDSALLVKREDTLTSEDVKRLARWGCDYPQLVEAFRCKEAFYKIYAQADKNQAIKLFESWYANVGSEIRWGFEDLITAWHCWQPYILKYWDHLNINEHAEALKSLSGVVDRLGRGYSFEALRAKILFTKAAFEREATEIKVHLKNDRHGETLINYGPKIASLVEMVKEDRV